MLCKYALKADKFGSNATYKTSNVHKWLDGTFATDLGLTKAELSLVREVNLSGSGGDGTDRFIIPAYGNNELNAGTAYKKAYYIDEQTYMPQMFWLRTVKDTSNVRVVRQKDDTVSARYSNATDGGKERSSRPMVYLDTNAIKNMAYSGTGTEADPYVFEPRYSVSANITPNGGGTLAATATRDGETIFNGKLPGDLVSGAEVTLTVTPETGYKLRNVSVKDADDNTVTVTNNKFTMPEKAVTVTVEFEIITVTWKNGDDVLETDEYVAEGEIPSYDGDVPTKDGCTFLGWTDGENVYAPDELPAVTGSVTYTAVFTYADGIGARVIGHTISLNGNIGVNFYMELSPEIAASKTAYMHFTIPNGNKTTEADVPLSQATIKGNYYIFNCDVSAKDIYSTVTGQIIDGELFGTEYGSVIKGVIYQKYARKK